MNYLKNTKIFDCHEHLLYPIDRLEQRTGLLDMIHYITSDLRTSGLSGEVTLEKLCEFYPNIIQTGYGKMLTIFAKDLYDVELDDIESFYLLDKKIREKSKDRESIELWYNSVLSDNNIVYSLTVDRGKFHQHNILKPIVYLDFLMQVDLMKNNTLSEQMKYVNQFLVKCINNKIVAGKFGTPYWHTLDIKKYTFEEAEVAYVKKNDIEPIVGYIFHYILKFFEEKNIPIQFHTGHIEPTATDISKYKLEWSKPNVFNEYATSYPKLKIILLHTGFPYQNEMLSLVKNHQNIYMDFSWIYIISPTLAKNTMRIALEMIPSNKIIGFGGDCEHIEPLYGHLVIAKNVINETLNDLVNSRWITEATAKVIAENILFNNPNTIYKLGGI